MRPADPKPVPPRRQDEVTELLGAVRRWAPQRADLHAVALVGSWARGNAHADSDVDIVLLTDTPDTYILDSEWAVRAFGTVSVLRTQRYGVLTERRMALAGGLVVEFGVVGPVWASTAPLDPGTAQVVAHGFVALYDPSGLLTQLAAAVVAQRA